jgi:UDP-N-acetylglucosamine 2-epimerase (non-hydrolysing)
MHVVERIEKSDALQRQMGERFSFLTGDKKTILVTGHRRESFGAGFEQICLALKALSDRGDVEIVYPVHLNPNVAEPVTRMLAGCPNVFLLPPLEYLPFVYLMSRALFILTDSGGIQEEAPSLRKPVLVMRDTTERPEAIEAAAVKLVGTNSARIVFEATLLLDDVVEYNRMTVGQNPYGDGHAADRIADVVANR